MSTSSTTFSTTAIDWAIYQIVPFLIFIGIHYLRRSRLSRRLIISSFPSLSVYYLFFFLFLFPSSLSQAAVPWTLLFRHLRCIIYSRELGYHYGVLEMCDCLGRNFVRYCRVCVLPWSVRISGAGEFSAEGTGCCSAQ